MQKTALYTAALVFTLVAIAHAVRLYTGFDIVIDSTIIPRWVSIPGVVVAGLLALWMVIATRRA